jgi:hypothetical protein
MSQLTRIDPRRFLLQVSSSGKISSVEFIPFQK